MCFEFEFDLITQTHDYFMRVNNRTQGLVLFSLESQKRSRLLTRVGPSVNLQVASLSETGITV